MGVRDTGAPPFGRGETASGLYGDSTATIDATAFEELVGTEHTFQDIDWSQRHCPVRSALPVTCRLVRNLSGVVLFPKKLVQTGTMIGTAGVKELGRVYRQVRETNGKAYAVDEFLPATGVLPNDLFWVVVEGPAMMVNAGNSAVAVTAGSAVVAATAHTTGETAAGTGGNIGGKIQGISYTANTDATGLTTVEQTENMLGVALSSAVSNVTGAEVLVNVGRY